MATLAKAIEPEKTHKRQRILSVKLEPDSETWKRLRELAWQQMRYKNLFLRARWAEAVGLRVDPEKGDPHDLTKHIRGTEKGELSGAAYSAAEREVAAVWTRDGRKIIAGAPLSEYRQNDSLAVRGHAKRKAESGIRIELENGNLVADLQIQSNDCEDGCWIRVPLAKGTGEDEYQRPKLLQMISWEVPITKGTIVFQPKRGRTYLRMAYEEHIPLPAMGERVATIGPVSKDGMRLFLRSETQSIDYSHKLTLMAQHKAHWDGIRRRVKRQIGRRRGAARKKRKVLSRISTGDWFQTFLHQWSDEVVQWCLSQGIATLNLFALGNGDWPAHQFAAYLKYKAEDAGIEATEEIETLDPATKRAGKREIDRERSQSKRKLEAVRTLNVE